MRPHYVFVVQIDEPEEQAERLAEMTSNTEELDEDDIATASFLLEDLTESAIVNREVNYSSYCSVCTLLIARLSYNGGRVYI